MANDVITKVLREYQQLRDKNAHLARQRKEEIYKKLPRIREIDDSISTLGIKLSHIVLKHPEDANTRFEKIKNKIRRLQQEKGELLAVNGYPVDYLEPIYNCSDCKDTGYIKGRQCHCFKQRLVDYTYAQSNLGRRLTKENFNTFNIEYYSDAPFGKEKLTPRKNMEIIYAACLNFVNTFDASDTNLLFYGSTGLGKTFLCNCIARELMLKGKTVVYQTAFKLFDILREYKFRSNRAEYDKKQLEDLVEADLLIIDDLGTEVNNAFISSELFNILNTRLIEDKKTIISTNLTLEELAKHYSERIISRIIGNYKIFKFYGEDIRKKRSL
ncbi:MAG TPA: ATP-binding protein [Clostridiales bacterium]|nr:ATP-binding protein [Clostridiales bacterium]